jgi:DNA repair protein SbcC/Rad50
MIPLKLRLHNFMCYRGDATLDLSGIHLACLAGDNGHGKSALLDGLTYALWGEARARREDELITLGTDEMEVELEFLLGSERHRVIRKRGKRGKTRLGALELQLWDGEQFTAQTGASTRETQARINQLLRMGYNTFINSAFLLQGRADEFARKPAGERKQILGDILGLSLYDEYEERARTRVKQLDEESQRFAGEIGSIEHELLQKPQHEAELMRVEHEFAEAESRLHAAEAALHKLRDEKRDLDQKAKQADDIERRISGARSETERLEAESKQKRETLELYDARAADGERIERGYAQWQAARQRNEELNVLLGQAVRFSEEKSRVERVMREARQELEFSLRSAQERIVALDAQIGEALESHPELERARQTLTQLAEKESQRDKLRDQREALAVHVAELKAANQSLRSHMDALKEKMTLLEGAAATCPVCRQPISVAEAARLHDDYLEEGRCAAETYRTNTELLNTHTWQAEQWKSGLQRLEQELRVKAALQAHEVRLSERKQRAESAQAERDTCQAQTQALQQQLEQQDYAHDERKPLATVDAQLAALGYSADEHTQTRQLLSELAPFEQELAQLHSARERVDAEREVLHHLNVSLERARQLIASDQAQWLVLTADLARLEAVNRSTVEQQRQVNDLQGRVAVLNRQLGAARQWVEHAKQMELTLVEKQHALKTTHMERALYEELRVSLGKKGVQAMLIEAAIPEIEQEANSLLGQMTDGRMNVRLETQREKLTAKKDEAATIETLDIIISDELGPRSYEMFSGGEAFRVNFAVRIALSKLLARRAGARLQTLVIDEGFGSLDTVGRERLVEAINAVQNQFEKVLVITHIEELKDLFPVRIDVVKTGGGSSIFVN